jgi:hypothetical protein
MEFEMEVANAIRSLTAAEAREIVAAGGNPWPNRQPQLPARTPLDIAYEAAVTARQRAGYEAWLAEDDDDDDDDDADAACSYCAGTGIGQHGDPDTSRCAACHGSGEASEAADDTGHDGEMATIWMDVMYGNK